MRKYTAVVSVGGLPSLTISLSELRFESFTFHLFMLKLTYETGYFVYKN